MLESTQLHESFIQAGDILVHKHIPEISIELIEPTNKGWKVYQMEGKKKKVAFFDSQDIKGDRALFHPPVK